MGENMQGIIGVILRRCQKKFFSTSIALQVL